MFRKTETSQQLDIFSSPSQQMQGSMLKNYQKNDSWHNLFREKVVAKINEQIFSVLFDAKQGAPNTSIRILVGMMILKEGQGWSDEQLFENCNYNLLIRSALGVMSLNENVPAPSTYYLFRHRLVEYNRENQEDLLKECQSQITKSQILEFGISGKQIRMDSKLMGSNITWYTRYELIHETLRLFIEEKEEHIRKRSLLPKDFKLIDSILSEDGNKVVYRSTKQEIDARFIELGMLMYKFVGLFKPYKDAQYNLLKTVFEQQFSVDKEKKVLPLENEKISAKSIQSPHDTDCHYRNKDGNKVKGYSVNVTETCDESTEKQEETPTINLITDTQVDVVSTSDNTFLQEAVENTEKLLQNPVESIYADGAYNSTENQTFCNKNDKSLILTALQGKESRYELQLDSQNNNQLIVIDHKTEKQIEVQEVKSRKKPTEKKWRIKTDEGKYRYFDTESLRTSQLRQKLREIPIEEKNIRNNVEATIFQLGYHYSNNKTRYRSLAKHQLWAYSRCLWINFIRILNYTTQISQRTLLGIKMPNFIVKLCKIAIFNYRIFTLKSFAGNKADFMILSAC